ncbi:MAG: FAD-dependent oxidoreductase, partial [Chlorobia bacterium]|nr:FAD-dependent oxidoreductase [Fimbriimonadaceae bacterium]
MPHSQVLIVGAGPTGLVLALWLTRAGITVRLIDSAAEPGTTSRAVGVQARTLEFYRQLGIADAVIDAGFPMVAINMWSRGRKAARIRFADMGEGLSLYPYMLIYPQDLHERLLLSELEKLGVACEREVTLVDVEPKDDVAVAKLRHANGTEEVVETPYLAGCDGASSQVRKSLGLDFEGGTYENVCF